jgi:hypothetical protein
MSAVAFLGGELATRENDSESEDEEKDEEKDKEKDKAKDKGSDKVSDDAPLSRPPTLTALPCKLVIDIWQTVAARPFRPTLHKRLGLRPRPDVVNVIICSKSIVMKIMSSVLLVKAGLFLSVSPSPPTCSKLCNRPTGNALCVVACASE